MIKCPLCGGNTTWQELEENDDSHCHECEEAYDTGYDERFQGGDTHTDNDIDKYNEDFEALRRDCNK